MDLENPDDFARLSTLFTGLSNPTRLALLIGFYHGYTANDVAAFLDITRAGVQDHITRLIDVDLVYRPADDDAPTYRLTPFGTFFARLLDSHGPPLLAALNMVATTKNTYRDELTDSPLADGLPDSERQKLIDTKTWDEVGPNIADRLLPLELDTLIAAILTEDPIDPSTVATVATLAPRNPDALLPVLPRLVELADPYETDPELLPNVLLAITELITSHPELTGDRLLDQVPVRRLVTVANAIVDDHLPIVANCAAAVFPALAANTDFDPDYPFQSITHVAAPRTTIIHLHQLLYILVEEYEQRDVITPDDLVAYHDLGVKSVDIHKAADDHQRAITLLARVLAPYLSDAQHQAAPTVPD